MRCWGRASRSAGYAAGSPSGAGALGRESSSHASSPVSRVPSSGVGVMPGRTVPSTAGSPDPAGTVVTPGAGSPAPPAAVADRSASTSSRSAGPTSWPNAWTAPGSSVASTKVDMPCSSTRPASCSAHSAGPPCSSPPPRPNRPWTL
ncbi:hypothetical protein [Ornithinimicrobium kibberense]|uniref:hypothetical protein n=1 Tax=Ornithinimicrobium kibberense TaxID=282060 RepID=UPI00361BFEB1